MQNWHRLRALGVLQSACNKSDGFRRKTYQGQLPALTKRRDAEKVQANQRNSKGFNVLLPDNWHLHAGKAARFAARPFKIPKPPDS